MGHVDVKIFHLTTGWVCLLIPGFKTDISSPVLFYVGRIFTGIGGGGFALAPPVYVSEITETSIRGAMGAMMQFMLTIGISFIYAMGIENAVDWSIITVLCIIPAGKHIYIGYLLQYLR